MKNHEYIQRFADDRKRPNKHSNSLFQSENGDTLYSYGRHFPLAVLDRTRKIAFLNANSYSVTTSKQQGYVRGACEQAGFTCYTVDRPEDALSEWDFSRNCEDYTRRIESWATKRDKARVHAAKERLDCAAESLRQEMESFESLRSAT